MVSANYSITPSITFSAKGTQGIGGALGGYTNTPQGKVIVAAFTDSYNQFVRAVRNYASQTMGNRGPGTGGRLGVEGGHKPMMTPTGGAPGLMSVADAQRKLAALREFQKDQNLPVNGRLDAATSAALSK